MRIRVTVVVAVVGVVFSATPSATGAPPPTGVRTVASVPAWIAPGLLFSTGRQVLLFGLDGTRKTGSGMRNAAAMYDLKRGRWTRTATPPFHPAIADPNAVWNGRELVVVGIACDNRAAVEDDEPRCYPGSLVAGRYDPTRDTWRRVTVPASLAAGFKPGNVGASGQSIGALGSKALFSISGEVWSLDARGDRWEQELPVGSAYVACVTGQRLVAQSASGISVIDIGGRTTETVPAVPAVDPSGPFIFVCGNDAVYAYTMVLTSAWRYRLDARVWEELPTPPQPPAFVSPAVWTGRELLIAISIRSRDPVTTTRDGFAFAQATNTWRTTPDAIVMGGTGGQVWSDGSAFQLGYKPSGEVLLQTYRPE